MKSTAKRKCHSCNEFYLPDRRNRHHQCFCSKPACRKRSKEESQRRWRQKAQNQNYFRGPENTERVRQWRARHPGYARKKKPPRPEAPEALQEICPPQAPPAEPLAQEEISRSPGALQDLWNEQHVVVVGLISMLSGSALQDDIADTARALLRKGREILGPSPGARTSDHCHDQTPPLSRAAAPRAAPV